jgi:hypothetical protein
MTVRFIAQCLSFYAAIFGVVSVLQLHVKGSFLSISDTTARIASNLLSKELRLRIDNGNAGRLGESWLLRQQRQNVFQLERDKEKYVRGVARTRMVPITSSPSQITPMGKPSPVPHYLACVDFGHPTDA